jgi:hypothetical protein
MDIDTPASTALITSPATIGNALTRTIRIKHNAADWRRQAF